MSVDPHVPLKLFSFPTQHLSGGVWIARPIAKHELEAGLYAAPAARKKDTGDDDTPRVGRVLLGGQLLITEISASSPDDKNGESAMRLDVRDDTGGLCSIWLTRKTCEDGSAFDPLLAIEVTLPAKSDRGSLWRLLRQVATRQREFGIEIVRSRAVLHYGWHKYDHAGHAGYVAAFANGAIGPRGRMEPAPLKITGAIEDDKQSLSPEPPPPGALDRAGEAVGLVVGLDGPGDRSPAAIYRLITAARVAWPPRRGERLAGAAPYLLERHASSQTLKSAVDNLVCRLFSGHGYEHNSDPDLNPQNTRRGNELEAATFKHLAFTTADGWAPPDSKEWAAQHAERQTLAHQAGSSSGGRTVSNRDGGRDRRARPVGAPMRTAEHDSRAQNIEQGAQGVDWRTITDHAGERDEVHAHRLAVSKRLFGDLATTLDVMRERYWQWISEATFTGTWAGRRERYERDADLAIAQINDPRMNGRVEEQLRYMLQGLYCYADFLHTVNTPESAGLLAGQGPRIIEYRLSDAAWLDEQQREAQGGATESERTVDALGDALRRLMRERRWHPCDQAGQPTVPEGRTAAEVGLTATTFQGETRLSAPGGSVPGYVTDGGQAVCFSPKDLRALLADDPRFRTHGDKPFSKQLDAASALLGGGQDRLTVQRVLGGGPKRRALAVRAAVIWDDDAEPAQRTGETGETGESCSFAGNSPKDAIPRPNVENPCKTGQFPGFPGFPGDFDASSSECGERHDPVALAAGPDGTARPSSAKAERSAKALAEVTNLDTPASTSAQTEVDSPARGERLFAWARRENPRWNDEQLAKLVDALGEDFEPPADDTMPGPTCPHLDRPEYHWRRPGGKRWFCRACPPGKGQPVPAQGADGIIYRQPYGTEPAPHVEPKPRATAGAEPEPARCVEPKATAGAEPERIAAPKRRHRPPTRRPRRSIYQEDAGPGEATAAEAHADRAAEPAEGGHRRRDFARAKVCCLDETGLFVEQLGRIADTGDPVTCGAHAVALALRYGCDEILIHPSAHARVGLPAPGDGWRPAERNRAPAPHPWAAGDLVEGSPLGRGGLEETMHWPGGAPHPGDDPRTVKVVVLGLSGATGTLAGSDGAETVVRALALLREGLKGFVPDANPGRTGARLMRAARSRRQTGSQPKDLGSPVLPPPVQAAIDAGINLVRPLALRTRRLGEHDRLPYMVAVDVRAYHLSACGVQLGIGQSSHHLGDDASRLWSATTPGWWRTRAPLPPPGRGLPDPFIGGRDAGGWYPTPSIAAAESLGMDLAIVEAWIYLEPGRYLRQFQDRVRPPIKAFEGFPVGSPEWVARRLLKSSVHRGLGRLEARYVNPSDEFYRPDLYATVRAEADRRLMERLSEAARPPLEVLTDCAVFACHAPTIEAACEELNLTLGANLGQFKPHGPGVIPTERAVRALEQGFTIESAFKGRPN